jgi:hypothetical protein
VKFFRAHRKVVSEGYVKLSNARQNLGMVFKRPMILNSPGGSTEYNGFLPIRGRDERHLKHFKPDAVLCTHYSPLETLGQTKGARASPSTKTVPAFVVSVVTI